MTKVLFGLVSYTSWSRMYIANSIREHVLCPTRAKPSTVDVADASNSIQGADAVVSHWHCFHAVFAPVIANGVNVPSLPTLFTPPLPPCFVILFKACFKSKLAQQEWEWICIQNQEQRTEAQIIHWQLLTVYHQRIKGVDDIFHQILQIQNIVRTCLREASPWK